MERERDFFSSWSLLSMRKIKWKYAYCKLWTDDPSACINWQPYTVTTAIWMNGFLIKFYGYFSNCDFLFSLIFIQSITFQLLIVIFDMRYIPFEFSSVSRRKGHNLFIMNDVTLKLQCILCECLYWIELVTNAKPIESKHTFDISFMYYIVYVVNEV